MNPSIVLVILHADLQCFVNFGSLLTVIKVWRWLSDGNCIKDKMFQDGVQRMRERFNGSLALKRKMLL